jgi:hypothetical protein
MIKAKFLNPLHGVFEQLTFKFDSRRAEHGAALAMRAYSVESICCQLTVLAIGGVEQPLEAATYEHRLNAGTLKAVNDTDKSRVESWAVSA